MNVVLVHVLGLLLIEWWPLLSEVGRVWCWGRSPPPSRCFLSILSTAELHIFTVIYGDSKRFYYDGLPASENQFN